VVETYSFLKFCCTQLGNCVLLQKFPQCTYLICKGVVMTQTIVITGASGRLGQACTKAFTHAGWRVVPHSLTLGLPAHKLALPAQADVLLHAASPPYTQWPTQALPLLERSIEISSRLGATLMLPGNVYNYQPLPARVDESAVQTSLTSKGRIRIAMEARLAAAAQQGVRTAVLRAGDFFGTGSGSWFDLALTSRLRKGQLVYPGAMDVVHAWAYLPDLAQAFVRLAERRMQLAPCESVHFAGHSLTGHDWQHALQVIAAEQGWVQPNAHLQLRSMPWWLMRMLSPVVPMWREVLEMQYLWDQPHSLAGDRLQRLAGPVSHTPLPLALQQALQQLNLIPAPLQRPNAAVV
jgi:NAD(P)-dependent dehydrogenase (short-subunit alcohol dehydrogenase family)